MTLVLTIGHSSHTLDRFLSLLRLHGVEAIADVRSWPRSRHAPWFDAGTLAPALGASGVAYVFLGAELGGRPDGPQLYDDVGRVRYDAVAATPAFERGLERLLSGATRMRVAAMCAEEDPAHCHRRLLVGRVLHAAGHDVRHIRGSGAVEPEPGFTGETTLFGDEELPWRSSRSVSLRPRPSTSSAGLATTPSSGSSTSG